MAKNGTLISVASSQDGATPRIVTETEPLPIALFDGYGNKIDSLNGGISVHAADSHRSIINKYVHQHTATETTLSADVAGNDTVYELPVVSAAGFAVGDYIHLNTGSTEPTHPKITAIVGNTLTIDRRLNLAHSAGDTVTKAIIDMAKTGQVGTMASPQVYWAAPVAGEVWHLTRMLFSMVHGTAGDLGLFGNLTELANGVTMRVLVNGQYYTFTNWKKSADMKEDMYDLVFDARSGGGGSYGTTGRGAFTNAGAIVRLDGALGDRFEIVVQDDITALDLFQLKVQGHLEDS